MTSVSWDALKRNGTRNTRDKRTWSFLSEFNDEKKIVCYENNYFFGIIFCNGNYKALPPNNLSFLPRGSNDQFPSCALSWKCFPLLFSLFSGVRFVLWPQVSFATSGVFIFFFLCSRLSLAWHALQSGAVWRLNLISKINITNGDVCCLRKEKAENWSELFSWREGLLFHDTTQWRG